MRRINKEKRNKSEDGVITVEACTSLMIFIFAFYVVLELMKVFAVEACMQDVLTSVAMDVSMGNYYGITDYYGSGENKKVSEDYRSMSGLVADDYNDARLSTIESSMTNPARIYKGIDYESCRAADTNALAAYHMKEQSNISRLITDEKVTGFNITAHSLGDKVIVYGEYEYELINIPFLSESGIKVFFDQKAVTYAWE